AARNKNAKDQEQRVAAIQAANAKRQREIDEATERKKSAVRESLAKNRSKILAAAEREKSRIRGNRHEPSESSEKSSESSPWR
ncbi:MAG TPA: hypothetical protein VJV78_46535, partial [Polyangiales bacterium]|nr:hypothetical protein [Polyangiales bacterium]